MFRLQRRVRLELKLLQAKQPASHPAKGPVPAGGHVFLLARLPGELGWISSAARELKPKACSGHVCAQELYWWDVPVWREALGEGHRL